MAKTRAFTDVMVKISSEFYDYRIFWSPEEYVVAQLQAPRTTKKLWERKNKKLYVFENIVNLRHPNWTGVSRSHSDHNKACASAEARRDLKSSTGFPLQSRIGVSHHKSLYPIMLLLSCHVFFFRLYIYKRATFLQLIRSSGVLGVEENHTKVHPELGG
nr:hypothetical protein Iba_chr09cCG7860 [Ipomoea batatas]